MDRHIGIVGCSAEGAALCYRTICVEGADVLGGHAHPEVSMHTHSLAAYVDALENGDLDAVAELMLSSAAKLHAAGADVLICPDNTIHQAMPQVRRRSTLPWLHIAEVVAGEALERGYGRLGLLGTQWLVESDVYPLALESVGITYVRPTTDDRCAVSRIIMDELVHGRRPPEAVRFIQDVIERFRSESACDAVVLGCTELPLILDDSNSALPTLDSTRLLARAALAFATGRVAPVNSQRTGKA